MSALERSIFSYISQSTLTAFHWNWNWTHILASVACWWRRRLCLGSRLWRGRRRKQCCGRWALRGNYFLAWVRGLKGLFNNGEGGELEEDLVEDFQAKVVAAENEYIQMKPIPSYTSCSCFVGRGEDQLGSCSQLSSFSCDVWAMPAKHFFLPLSPSC